MTSPIWLRVGAAVGLLALGVLTSLRLLNSRPSASQEAPPPVVPVVQLMPLQAEPRRAVVGGTGIVTPAREVNLSAQVSGQVSWISPDLVPGARVARGDALARLDPRDFKLAVEQRQSAIRSAEVQIEQERALQALAKHEWETLGEPGDPSPLFSRETQLHAAQATLASGRSALRQAELNLSRTTVRAPFDATVVRKSVDVGQVVAPGASLAYLVGTEELWVMVSVRLDELVLMHLPGSAEAQAAPATVTQRLAQGGAIRREGRVTRLVEQLDQQTRRAQVVVSLRDALGSANGLPLLPGAVVNVEIAGKRFDNIHAIPRQAVYDASTVWVSVDSQLQRRELKVVWGNATHLFASAGVESGEQLVVTRLANPMAGQRVQSLEQARAQAKSAAKPAPAPSETRPASSPRGGPAPTQRKAN